MYIYLYIYIHAHISWCIHAHGTHICSCADSMIRKRRLIGGDQQPLAAGSRLALTLFDRFISATNKACLRIVSLHHLLISSTNFRDFHSSIRFFSPASTIRCLKNKSLCFSLQCGLKSDEIWDKNSRSVENVSLSSLK